MEQESPEVDSCEYNQLIFDKGVRQCNAVKTASLKNGDKLDIYMQKTNPDADFTPVIKNNSEVIRDLNINHKTKNFPEGNIQKNLDGLGYGDAYFDTIQSKYDQKER